MSSGRTWTFRSDSVSREYPYGYIEDEFGVRFALGSEKLQFTQDGVEWPGFTEPLNPCSTCGRADWVVVPAQSFDQAVKRGWLIEIPARGSAHDAPLPRREG